MYTLKDITTYSLIYLKLIPEPEITLLKKYHITNFYELEELLSKNIPELCTPLIFELMRLAYKVLKDIKEENENATATVEVTVLNYRSAILEAEEELKSNPDKFNDDEGKFSEEKYMDYKIEKMSKVDDTTTHTIDLNLTKNAGMWTVDQLSSDDISKLHGLY